VRLTFAQKRRIGETAAVLFIAVGAAILFTDEWRHGAVLLLIGVARIGYAVVDRRRRRRRRISD
jgi:hypothetical protein